MKFRTINRRLTTAFFTSIFIITSASGTIQVTDTISNKPAGNVREASAVKSFRRTSLTFGGNGLNLTRVNGQFNIMTGGRGSATFNDRFTIGGGGWGMTKGVSVESNTEGVYNFIKMGYGGIDFGYLFIPGEKLYAGIKLLAGGGAVFSESVPEKAKNDFKMFSVFEPSVYFQIPLGKLLRFETGTSYRYILGKGLPDAPSSNLRGYSIYFGFLVSAGK